MSALYRIGGRALGMAAFMVACFSGALHAQEAVPPSAAGTINVAPVAAVAPDAAAADAPSTPAAPPPAADAASELAALRAEVDALKAKQEEAETAALLTSGDDSAGAAIAEPELLRVYGFMDFGLDKYFISQANDGFALLRPTAASTFVFGNLNLYFEAKPVEHLRTMVELRFTVAPHGEEITLGPPLGGTSYERTDTTAFDFSSPSSQAQLRLGGLYIERAYTEYSFSELFKVQWGMFLTPFGIWNLDHGSPTLISLMLPTFVAAQMMPTRVLGVLVYGSKFFGGSELGYALHVSNGRTPLDFDLSEDKAIGGRLYFANEGDLGRLVLGASGYVGTYVDKIKKVNGDPKNLVDWVDTVSYSEQVVGVDVAVDVSDLRFRSEAVLRWVEYDGDKSERLLATDGSVQYLPNRLEWAGYALLAYRTPWRIEPYLEVEPSSKSYTLPRWAGANRASSANLGSLSLSVGLNVELTTHTLLKGQLVWARAYDRKFEHKSLDMPYLFIRVVDSF